MKQLRTKDVRRYSDWETRELSQSNADNTRQRRKLIILDTTYTDPGNGNDIKEGTISMNKGPIQVTSD